MAFISLRYYMSIMFFFGIGIQTMHRVAFNIAITEITKREPVKKDISSVICHYGDEKNNTEKLESRIAESEKFEWDTTQQARLLSSFFYGYLLTQIPGGMLADKFGPKRVMGYSVVVSALCSLLTPVSARTNIYALIFIRAVMGLAQGPIYPAKGSFIARWSLPDERRWTSTIINVGAWSGYIVGQAMTGIIMKYSAHWDSVFIIYSIASILWFILWNEFVFDSASVHPYICDSEKQLMEVNLKGEVGGIEDAKMNYWGTLKSVPMWSMVAAEIGHDWMYYVMASLLPTYMAYILQFRIAENGIVSSIPWVTGIVFVIVTGKIAYTLVHRGILSRTMQSKIFMLISNEGPCLCFLAVTYSGCSRELAILFFSLALGLLGMCYSSLHVANIDIAPNMAGFVMAIMNSVGAICGALVPEIFALFVTTHTIKNWRAAFFLTAGIVSVLTVVYLIFGTSEIQKWNYGQKKSANEENKQEDISGQN